jgi:hypothetical protein
MQRAGHKERTKSGHGSGTALMMPSSHGKISAISENCIYCMHPSIALKLRIEMVRIHVNLAL